MVHTRHTRDADDDTPPRFLSLEDKRTRKPRSRLADVHEHDSDHSGADFQENNPSIFEEKVVDSRLRPRTGPRAYNYVYGDSSEEEVMSRRRRSMINENPFEVSRSLPGRSSRRRARTLGESSDEEEEEEAMLWRGSREARLRSRRRPPAQLQSDENDETDGNAQPAQDTDEEVEEEEEEEDDDLNNSALRRSSRLRNKPSRFRSMSKAEGGGDDAHKADKGKKRRPSEEDFNDMYSRAKRPRRKKPGEQNSASNSDGTHDEDKNDSDNGKQQRRSYSLREHKPRTQLYSAPVNEAKTRPKTMFRETPPRRTRKDTSYRSPAHRRANVRKRRTFHGGSSSTSSDSDSAPETSDEQRFNRRKAKSLAKAKSRICPLNFTPSDMSVPGVLKDRVRTGASLADVDPMEIDKSVTFDSVGGLQKHIMALKEMVVFPLIYPEFYDHFKVQPSRGVLFYGPPGTGKTLVARALANECSHERQKVAFFMRKGADCLSKWVGEAERQLRLLFDKAYEMRPSIIFFDEIDGLAPVRSSRQDQIHSSIVSTLLALMDGIDSRGEIVVIGATNRIDSIDPALRRPGRFDREFHFPLPNLEDRKKILKIHTKNWAPALRDDFISELAEKCAGYCGADIKCLVTESTQNALRRHYPQIYTSRDKLQLDIPSIQLAASDFAKGLLTIVPAAQRAVASPAVALEMSVRPLLQRLLQQLQQSLAKRFPQSRQDGRAIAAAAEQGCSTAGAVQDLMELASDEEDSAPSIFVPKGSRVGHTIHPQSPATYLNFSMGCSGLPVVFRPRLLVSGAAGQGQTTHLAPAALHMMEHLPVHTLCSSSLFASSAKMPEEACAHVFHEAKRTAPSIIYMPYINELWGVVSESLRVTFMTLTRSMNPSTPILLLATSEAPYRDLDEQLRQLFSLCGGEVVEVDGPTSEERRQFFADLILQQTAKPPPTHKQAEISQVGNAPNLFFPRGSLSQDVVRNANNEVIWPAPSSEQAAYFCEQTLNPRNRFTQTHRGSKSSREAGRIPSKTTVANLSSSSNRHFLGKKTKVNFAIGRGKAVISSHSNKGWSRSTNSFHSSKKAQKTHKSKSSSSKTGSYKGKQSSFDYQSLKGRLEKHSSYTDKIRFIAKQAASKRSSYSSKKKHHRGKTCVAASKKHATGRKGKSKKKCKKGKHRRKKNLNCNNSAGYYKIAEQQQLLYSELLLQFGKMYPCRRSPYNNVEKTTCESDLYESWHQMDFTSHWLRSEARRVLEPLKKAPPPEPRKLTDKEQRKLVEREEDTLRELRIFLRDILSKLGREKKFSIFTKPVDIDEVPDYYEIIKKPMDLSTMMANIDLHKYNTASSFLKDIILICSNALEYNPDRGPTDRAIRHRACCLRDMAQALLKTELDPEFEKMCQEIESSRKRRGIDSSKEIPNFYHTRPLIVMSADTKAGDAEEELQGDLEVPEGCRYSRRVRGLDADRTLPLEAVEKTVTVERTLLRQESPLKAPATLHKSRLEQAPESASGGDASIMRSKDPSASLRGKDIETDADLLVNRMPTSSKAVRNLSPAVKSPHASGSSSKHSSKKSKGHKCPWTRPRRRRRHHHSTPPTPGHTQESASTLSDAAELSDKEETETSPPDHQSWSSPRREHRDDSPLSAANPANVNVLSASRLRRHSEGNEARAVVSEDSQVTEAASVEVEAEAEDKGKASKSSSARSLDLDLLAVATDSGVSSESNGDSRDSLDHNTAIDVSNNARHESNEEQPVPSTSTACSGKVRTRSHSNTHNQRLQARAQAALEEEQPAVQVDKERLARLLDTVVAQTRGFSIERLQQLYSMLSCAIFAHRKRFDKTLLVQEMEETVDHFCQESAH